MNTGGRYVFTVVGLALLGLSFTAPLSGELPRSVQHAWQLGHVVLFFCWVYVLFPALARHIARTPGLAITIILLSALFGLAIESLQILAGRDFSLQDIAFDLCGTLLAFSLLAMKNRLSLVQAYRRCLYGFTILLSLYTLSPFCLALTDELLHVQAVPRLAEFDNRLSAIAGRGDVSLASLVTADGTRKVLQLNLDTQPYSTVSMNWFPRDWRGFSFLKLDAYVPGQKPIQLTLRIHDAGHFSARDGDFHDRFNRVIELQPGWNYLGITLEEIKNAPRQREMDLSSIQQIALFGVDLPQQRQLFIDSIRLE